MIFVNPICEGSFWDHASIFWAIAKWTNLIIAKCKAGANIIGQSFANDDDANSNRRNRLTADAHNTRRHPTPHGDSAQP